MEVLEFDVSSDMVEDEDVFENLESLFGVLFAKGVGILLGFLGILRAKINTTKNS